MNNQTQNQHSSPEDTLFMIGIVAFAVLLGVLWTSAEFAMWLFHGRTFHVSTKVVAQALFRLPKHLSDPAAAWPAPFDHELPDAAQYWFAIGIELAIPVLLAIGIYVAAAGRIGGPRKRGNRAAHGYLIVCEMLGQTVARQNTVFTDRGGSEKRSVAGAQEFANPAITEKDARALYGLRCALAHEYGLRSANSKVRHMFELSQAGPLVVHPPVDWVQVHDLATGKDEWPIPTKMNETKVNVRAVGAFVEELVNNVRAEHQAGNVYLAPGSDPLHVRNFGQFLIT